MTFRWAAIGAVLLLVLLVILAVLFGQGIADRIQQRRSSISG